MNVFSILEREITTEELAQVQTGFEQHSREHGNPPKETRRITFAGQTPTGQFIGCVSGLVNDNGCWLYITDLFVEDEYRRRGLGTALLRALKKKAADLGVEQVWLWTEFDAPAFYARQGYAIFCELENFYPDGSAHIGMRKTIFRAGAETTPAEGKAVFQPDVRQGNSFPSCTKNWLYNEKDLCPDS